VKIDDVDDEDLQLSIMKLNVGLVFKAVKHRSCGRNGLSTKGCRKNAAFVFI